MPLSLPNNNKEVKFQALFLSIHLFDLSPFNYRTMKSFFYLDLYIQVFLIALV